MTRATKTMRDTMQTGSRIFALAMMAICLTHPAFAQNAPAILTGEAAMGDWKSDAPGVSRHIRPDQLPAPYATKSASASARVVPQPPGAQLAVPPGYKIERLAANLPGARTLRFAPNGDLFVAQTAEGRITILRSTANGTGMLRETFAADLDGPFGLAFYPADKPQWLYVGTEGRVLRFPYTAGDLRASAKPEIVVPGLPSGGHSTRDVLFSHDSKTMLVSVGSQSNAAERMGSPPADLAAFEKTNGRGAGWGSEIWRASVLAFDIDGKNRRSYANGLRNCVAIAFAPNSGPLWCATNERDLLGDNLPPDYATSVREGGFYGWPWFYLGANPDPRHPDARRDLANAVTVPDVLIQSHSAPLGIAFNEGGMFPADAKNDGFVALHGSWNRALRTGYKIVRLRFEKGRPTGAYEDFVTGFVVSDTAVWGRPVSITMAPDGALLFSEDGNGTIWRVSYSTR